MVTTHGETDAHHVSRFLRFPFPLPHTSSLPTDAPIRKQVISPTQVKPATFDGTLQEGETDQFTEHIVESRCTGCLPTKKAWSRLEWGGKFR